MSTNFQYERVDNTIPLLPSLSSSSAIVLEGRETTQIDSGIYMEENDFNRASLIALSVRSDIFVFPQVFWEEGQLLFDVSAYQTTEIEGSEPIAILVSTNKLLATVRPKRIQREVDGGTNLISVQYQGF